MKAEQRKTLRLLLAGLAASESAGSSSEFVPQSEIPKLYAKLKSQGWPFVPAGGGAFNWRKGEMTDDGEQALCLIRSYVERGEFDPEDVGKHLVAWLDSGPRDVGGTTARTLSALRAGKPWHEAALGDYLANPKNAANGSIMRAGVLPGIMFGQELDLLFRAAVQNSMITHTAPLPTLCCAIHAWLLADLLSDWKQGPLHDGDWLSAFYEDWTGYVEREDDPFVNAWLDRMGKAMQSAGDIITEADWNPFSFSPFTVDYAGRSGYVVLALQISVFCLLWSDMPDEQLAIPPGFPAEVFKKRGPWTCAWPAMFGWDADTVGAVFGPLCAAAHGSVPESMTQGLEALAEFDALIPPGIKAE
jgi:ADP-ribosylglycohydrolase